MRTTHAGRPTRRRRTPLGSSRTPRNVEVTLLNTHATAEVKSADARFFKALLDRDAATLDALLGDDFLIVELGTGLVHPRADFLGAVENGLVVFEAIEVDTSETVIREYGTTAIAVGRTLMKIAGPDGSTVEAASRYSHVFALDRDRWRLVSAQGTPIVE
jgi:ketosteroid isomerase-like protein